MIFFSAKIEVLPQATKREDSIILKVRSFTRGTLVDAVDYKSVRLWSFLLDGFNFALAKLLKHPIHLGAWEKPTLFPFYIQNFSGYSRQEKNSLSEWNAEMLNQKWWS